MRDIRIGREIMRALVERNRIRQIPPPMRPTARR
jgi:hypothetical protein